MSDELARIILALVLGVVFYFVDLNSEKIRINPSIIAGISLSYFFLVVLPEVSLGLPEFPFDLPTFEYLFILIGLVFTHFIEKMIVQRVEKRTRERAHDLMKKKDEYDTGENRLSHILKTGLDNDSLDDSTIRNLASIIAEAIQNEEDTKKEIEIIKDQIRDHVNRSLGTVHSSIEVFYHAIIGIILGSLLIAPEDDPLVQGLLFFVFAFFMAVVAHVESRQRIFSDMDIELEYKQPRKRKAFLSLAAPLGVIFSLVIQLSLGINLEAIYLLFSFISGAILYTIIREVIPEKERGNPVLFVASFATFAVLIFIIKFIEHSI
ncbi:MAG: hypothetical protein ACTSUE_25465 [Promethearchaeota archaeon]